MKRAILVGLVLLVASVAGPAALDYPRYHGLPWFHNSTVAVSIGTVAIDAAGEKIAVVFTVPPFAAGTKPARVWFRATTVTTAQDIKVSFQDLDASGDPDGGVDQFRVYPLASLTANAAHRTGLVTSDGTDTGSLRTLTVGGRVAVVIEFDSVTGNVTIPNVINQSSAGFGDGYRDLFVAGWTKAGMSASIVAIEMDNGAFLRVPGTVPFVGGAGTSDAGLNNETFSSASNPSRRGNIWTPSRQSTVTGIWAHLDYDNAVDLVLYDTDGTTPLATVAAPASAQRLANSILLSYFTFSSPVTVNAGSSYRVAVVPGAGSTIAVRCGGPAGALSSYFGAMYSTTWNGSVWSNVDSGIYMIGPVVSEEASGGVSAARVPNGM